MLDTYHALQLAIEQANLEEIRTGFDAFGQRIAEVPAEPLSADMQPMWAEVQMLLRNDAVEGREVTSMQEADRVFSLARQHVEQFQQYFAIGDRPLEPVIEMLDVPPAITQQIERLLAPYLQLGTSLAADQVDPARTAVQRLQALVAELPASESDAKEEGKANVRWQQERRHLSQIAARLVKAEDLAAMRRGFALLSEEMLSLLRIFGVTPNQELYELHCPMVFDGRGASWIQTDEAVRNPYYGAAMLKCADRVEGLRVEN
jgi:Cu(I)/Ag(I) efflux system membrane fusion protein